ncbi:hypothetical protein CELL_03197 [Cellulomonas sp. T2.31MG-18]|uniref:Shedu immune nuclease family protein n=1 Tax=Cellulomonas sp. T2.31MG-18 TaxID=3157619 RepID=UPI0035ED8FBC
MTMPIDGPADDETYYAQGRVPGRTYASRGFSINVPESRDFGKPARFAYRVLDVDEQSMVSLDGHEWVVAEAPGGRYQFKLLIARDAGQIKDIWIQKIPAPGASGRARTVLNLKRDDAMRLAEFFRAIDAMPVDSGVAGVRVDDDVIKELFSDPDAAQRVYQHKPAAFRSLIEDDATARDVIAVAHRRAQVARFRRLLEDDAYFDSEAAQLNGPESVWQALFEENPWILGLSVGAQLLLGNNPERLEQVVVGATVAGPGKRVDALLSTAGTIRSMVFAEIKTHRTQLLAAQPYRPGCWGVSAAVAGAVSQVQGTVQRAASAIGERLPQLANDGSEIPGSYSYLLRPRSYLIVGHLGQFLGTAGGQDRGKFTSFELFRRHMQEPEVVTFDELLARAEWLVASDA